MDWNSSQPAPVSQQFEFLLYTYCLLIQIVLQNKFSTYMYIYCSICIERTYIEREHGRYYLKMTKICILIYDCYQLCRMSLIKSHFEIFKTKYFKVHKPGIHLFIFKIITQSYTYKHFVWIPWNHSEVSSKGTCGNYYGLPYF